jgi:very-short-patch-repair endonuclease
MTQIARRLRRDMTYPEHTLWRLLRSRELDGLKFRRQHPIGPYVADFYCAAASLVIEVDGQSHEDPDADARREAYLQGQGLKVLRVTNDQVLYERQVVLDAILEVAEARMREKDPHPGPLPMRERG